MKLLSAKALIPLSIAAAFAVGITVATLLDGEPQPQAANSSPVERQGSQQPELARLARLEAELASLGNSPTGALDDARLDGLRAEMSELRKILEHVATAGRQAHGSHVAQDTVDPAQELLQEQERTQRIVGFLDQAFASAGTDAAWSSIASAAISGSLANPDLQRTRLGDVRCQATLCRIEATHAASDAEQNFVLNLIQLEAFRDADAFLQRSERDDGTVATTIFVSRTGYRLPSPG